MSIQCIYISSWGEGKISRGRGPPFINKGETNFPSSKIQPLPKMPHDLAQPHMTSCGTCWNLPYINWPGDQVHWPLSSLWHDYDIIMTSPWHHHDINTTSLWHQHVINMSSTCHFYEIVMTPSWYHHDTMGRVPSFLQSLSSVNLVTWIDDIMMMS